MTDSNPTQVLVDETQLKASYANSYRIHTTAEEVVVDMGFNMPDPNGKAGSLLFQIGHRVILSRAQANRLAKSLIAVTENMR